MSGSSGGLSSVSDGLKTIIIKCLWVLGIGFFLFNIFTTQQVAFYYPYEDDLEVFYQSTTYVYTHATCREWAREEARERGAAREGLYACGQKCTYHQDHEEYTCTRVSGPASLYTDTGARTVLERIRQE